MEWSGENRSGLMRSEVRRSEENRRDVMWCDGGGEMGGKQRRRAEGKR